MELAIELPCADCSLYMCVCQPVLSRAERLAAFPLPSLLVPTSRLTSTSEHYIIRLSDGRENLNFLFPSPQPGIEAKGVHGSARG